MEPLSEHYDQKSMKKAIANGLYPVKLYLAIQ